MEEKIPVGARQGVPRFQWHRVGWIPAAGTAAGVPRILSVGRYVEKKGFADLIEACRLLRERGREFACDIIGGGPLEAALQAQIEQAQLGAIGETARPARRKAKCAAPGGGAGISCWPVCPRLVAAATIFRP